MAMILTIDLESIFFTDNYPESAFRFFSPIPLN
ncbi:hypothetical protein BB2000_0660 [Proteus mirabilis BB2000]|nr:hypothetical protein BB2000_0660 [Proteus mirabilis BB2000]